MASSHVLDVSEQDFERDVIARSHEVPVVVDFWAAWCGPCRTLSPLLERLADEADGSWILAKVDVDANPGLAARFRVQGIPAVHAFKDGADTAEFVGALPEPRVREWLGQLGPSEADRAFAEGKAAEERGDTDSAIEAYGRALKLQSNHLPAREAKERLELSRRVERVDFDAMRKRFEADHSDVDAATALADVAAAEERMDEAADVLIDAVKETSGDERDRARLHLLRLLDTLPPDHPVALRARKSLSLALF
jgi:putative thioredoxin